MSADQMPADRYGGEAAKTNPNSWQNRLWIRHEFVKLCLWKQKLKKQQEIQREYRDEICAKEVPDSLSHLKEQR
jgi:hypothetical protein